MAPLATTQQRTSARPSFVDKTQRFTKPATASLQRARNTGNLATPHFQVCPSTQHAFPRRQLLIGLGAAAGWLHGNKAQAGELQILSNEEGFGTRPAQVGDLVMVHYIGTIDGTATVFDSTKGGMTYRDGGPGVFRPVITRLGGDPQPGICAGLRQAVVGMKVGGRRSVTVPPEIGFGSNTVLAPYAIIPGGSTLRYDIELIRLSARGPDELTKGIERCGTGGLSETADKCRQITPAEFI